MAGALPVSMISTYMATQFEAKAKAKKQIIVDAATGELNDIQRQTAQWRAFETKIKESAGTLDTVRMRIEGMLNVVDNMTLLVNQAESETTPGTAASTFNSYLGSLHRQATSGGLLPNLTGLSQGTTMTYPISVYGAEATVAGNFLGSEYRIDDSLGKSWIVDRNLDTIKRWDAYPDTESGQSANLKDGLQFVSESGGSITFVYAPNTASPETVTGTITSSGLPLKDSWYYEALTTEAGRTRALADLESTKNYLKAELARYSSAGEIVAYHQSRIEAVLGEFTDKQIDINVKSYDEQSKVQEDSDRQRQMAMMALSAQQSGYGELLNMLKSGKKTGTLQFNATSLFSVKA